ncbi:MAG TPA: hypothetical protein VIH99_06040 [Bdellovibrionota bacterium]|jgi:hypothetical protein
MGKGNTLNIPWSMVAPIVVALLWVGGVSYQVIQQREDIKNIKGSLNETIANVSQIAIAKKVTLERQPKFVGEFKRKLASPGDAVVDDGSANAHGSRTPAASQKPELTSDPNTRSED